MILGLAAVALAAILRSLPEQLCLQRKDVVEHTIDTPAFEAMVCDHSRAFEVATEQGAERPIYARAASHLGVLQQLKAAVERKLPQPVLTNRHLGVMYP